ncbi:MAG: hypothetical protein DI607_12885, partial [Sphingomonas hengshuiensis]
SLDVLLEGLQDLITEVKESTGDEGTVVNLDENGVVQDDPSVDQVIDGDPAPIGDDDPDSDFHSAIASLTEASADPFTRTEKDPLAGKGAITAAARRRQAAQNDQFAKDVANLDIIASSMAR